MKRVLLVGMPRLLVDIILPIVASEPDMSVVGQVSRSDLFTAARHTRADIVVVGQGAKDDREEREEYTHLLLELPRLKVLTIADDARSAALFELQPRRVPLGEVSANTLRSAIRGSESATQ